MGRTRRDVSFWKRGIGWVKDEGRIMKDEIYHYIPEEETFAKRLNARLENCREAIIASAFFTNGAFQEFRPSLESALRSGAKITFLIGRLDFVTEPKAVKGLLHLAPKYPKQLSIYFDSDFYFHYKLARFKTHDASVTLIGSSNLTPKGLASIGEVNLEIVNNVNIFKQTGKMLNERIQVALDAQKYLEEYQGKYNQAKKYRRQRRNWEKSGQSKLTGKRKVKQNWAEPSDKNFVLCWMEGYVNDKVLKSNISKERKKDISKGVSFPDQWVHFERKSEAHNYSENQVFVVLDENSHCMGFAQCTKIIRAMNSKGDERPVLFYRYLRGWRAQFTKDTFEAAKNKVGFRSDGGKIGKTLSDRLKNFLKGHRKKRLQNEKLT